MRLRSLVAPLVLFVLVLIQAATLALTARALSPYDEGAHFDYVTQILDGDFPVPAGTHYTDETIQTWACRPNDKAFPLSGLCGQPRPVDDAGIPFLGVNYEAQFGPLYYLLAATGTKLLGPFGVGHFGAARLVSATVYALGVALLMFVAQRLAVSSWAAAGVLLAASATGLSLSTGSTVTPDSMAFLYTAGVIWAAVLVRPWRWAVISTASVCALAGLTKPNFIVLAALGAALLLLRSLNAEPRVRNINAEARLLAAVAAPVLASAVAAGAWGLSARALAAPGANIDGNVHAFLQSDLGWLSRVAEQVSALLRPDGGTIPGPAFSSLDSPLLRALALLVVIVTLGACIASWLWSIGSADQRAVMVLRGVALAIPVSAVMLTVVYAVAYQGVHQPASRYALPLLAAAALATGSCVSRRAGPYVAVVGLAIWMATFLGMF